MLDELEGISPRRKAFDRIVVEAIETGIRFFIRHWLLLANAFTFAYSFVPSLAPVFMALHLDWLGKAIYFLYKPACHQLPYRSFFLFGESATYSAADLGSLMNPLSPADLLGNATLGYKVAFCERDLALYGSMFVGGLVFALVRHRLRPLPWLLYGLLILPMAVDGFSQLFFLRESTWELRVITGTLFGLATVWLAYPYLEREFAKARAGFEAPPLPAGQPAEPVPLPDPGEPR